MCTDRDEAIDPVDPSTTCITFELAPRTTAVGKQTREEKNGDRNRTTKSDSKTFFSDLHDTEHPEIIRDLLPNLIHVAPDESHVLLSQPASIARHFVLVLKREKATEISISNTIQSTEMFRMLTAKVKMEPTKFPSSYLPSLESTESRTETSLETRPALMLFMDFSIRSSIFVWYLCYERSRSRSRFSNSVILGI